MSSPRAASGAAKEQALAEPPITFLLRYESYQAPCS
jgi:hypothetical protein